MPELNRERIFNESPKKVLIREFNNLKEDYTKMNAIKYKTLYENSSLSFILENSEFIFTEPMRGVEFYKKVIEEATIPLDMIEDEYLKVLSYCESYIDKMSETQKTIYTNLYESIESKYNSMKNSSGLYKSITENSESMHKYYDALYEYNKNNDEKYIDEIASMMTESDSLNIIDTVNIISSIPQLYSQFLEYVEDTYVESPTFEDEYMLNAYTANVMSRICRDNYIKEKVNSISNMNLRHLLKGLAGLESSDFISNITEKVVNKDDVINYSTAENAINRIFEDKVFEECLQEVNDEEKCLRLVCEKAVIDMNLVFISMESEYTDNELAPRDSVVERICVESTEIEKIPQTYDGQIELLMSESEKLQHEIDILCERYFRPDGSPSRVVAKSIGVYGRDKMTDKNKKNDKIDIEDHYQSTEELYEPKKKSTISLDKNDDKENEESDDDKENEESDDDINLKKREEKKSRLTEKYSKMNIDSELEMLTEGKDNKEIKNDKETKNNKESKNDKETKDDEKEKSPEVQKPEKPNIFRRISNDALDMNSKFKRTVANGKRTATDAKNAGVAVTKIPKNISDSLKRTIDDFEEMNDNKRKEYMMKPGTRKKYFRALKTAITHGCAFAISPLLNVVLLICRTGTKQKDVRLRNELVRELKAEIKITEEKIEDAKSNGDNQQKYKLMRIKEKLEAELARVLYNSKVI